MKDERPNILFIMSDDHASHAMSCYGSRINKTPNLDRISDEGIRFDKQKLTPILKDGIKLSATQLRLNPRRLGTQWQDILEEVLRRVV